MSAPARPSGRPRRPRLDEPLKVLLREHAAELGELLGEPRGAVRSAGSLELNTLTRRLDCVLDVRLGRERHYRIVEFEARLRRPHAARFLLYCAQLMEQTRRPVLLTVVTLAPPAPPDDAFVLEVAVGGRTRNRWSFDLVRLWELDARTALQRGTPGFTALVPLMRGGRDLRLIRAASEVLKRDDPPDGLSETHGVLMALAARYYTVAQLARIVGRDKLMQSSIWREAQREGEREGRLLAARRICRALVERHQPGLLPAALTVIERCQSPTQLERWALAAPTARPAAFARALRLTRAARD